jgi:hypothetical protein
MSEKHSLHALFVPLENIKILPSRHFVDFVNLDFIVLVMLLFALLALVGRFLQIEGKRFAPPVLINLLLIQKELSACARLDIFRIIQLIQILDMRVLNAP